MHPDQRVAHELEDDFALFIARLHARRCPNVATEYARSLQMRAMVAFTAGCIDDAVWYNEREFEFSCRAFGISHPYAKASMKSLQALKQCVKTVAQTHDPNVDALLVA